MNFKKSQPRPTTHKSRTGLVVCDASLGGSTDFRCIRRDFTSMHTSTRFFIGIGSDLLYAILRNVLIDLFLLFPFLSIDCGSLCVLVSKYTLRSFWFGVLFVFNCPDCGDV